VRFLRRIRCFVLSLATKSPAPAEFSVRWTQRPEGLQYGLSSPPPARARFVSFLSPRTCDEHPNRFLTDGTRRGLQELREAAGQGRTVVSSQRFEVLNSSAMVIRWSWNLNGLALLPIPCNPLGSGTGILLTHRAPPALGPSGPMTCSPCRQRRRWNRPVQALRGIEADS
jgi:hypothetical protein